MIELQKIRRIVVKVGTSVLTDADSSQVTRQGVQSLASEIAGLRKQKKEVIVVTSGAIGVGMGILGLKKRPQDLSHLQAAAATGQGLLMQWYTAQFEEEGFHAAQLLLTREDLEARGRYLNAQSTLLTLLKAGVVPIINENDTISVEEIRYGDNDVLSAHIATLVGADLLVLLSDVDRLVGPREPLSWVTEITPELERAARGSGKAVSTGGMRTKLEAARIVMASGIPMVLINGRVRNSLIELISGRLATGTWFLPAKAGALKSKQRWVAFTGKPKGMVRVDAGAREALSRQGRSLLASGVQAVEGSFRRGDLVRVADESGREFGRGIVGYSHSELEKIQGLKSEAVAQILGRKAAEVIHRDSLVILKRE